MASKKQGRSFPSITRCDTSETASYESIAADLDGTLLISRSSFPYFMLVAIEAGSLLRGFVLLLSLPLVIVSYLFVSEALGIQILIFISFAGLKVRDIELASRAVLPRLRPRVLVDVSRIDMSTTVLGYKISAPIMIAPTSMHQLAHPEGEVATARAAAASNTIMVFKRRDISAQIVQRAEKNGYKAIVLTVDAPRLGRREADIKNKMISPQLKNFEGLISTELLDSDEGSNLEAFVRASYDDSLCWEDVIGWLKSITNLPILVKGILTHEDARKAVEVGVAGIVVSNHGARQLNYTPATISVLEEVIQAVGGKVPVLFDGGIRRETDVFKALALGAQAVLVGRPVIYGLAANGEDGVRKVLKMLKDELELTMALSGCPSVKDITRSHVRTECERLRSQL